MQKNTSAGVQTNTTGKPLNWRLSIALSTAGDGIKNWTEMTECEALNGKKESNQCAAYKTSERTM